MERKKIIDCNSSHVIASSLVAKQREKALNWRLKCNKRSHTKNRNAHSNKKERLKVCVILH